ncbi:MAG: glutamine synthetase [Lachnospiraceae bacterium]|nr:glutamine synthetase [Lachnospiraceae bacterium]
MKYTKDEVLQYVKQENVWFIRLAFCDVFGKLKNIAILPSELERAFEYGIAIDASAIAGFGGDVRSDLFLYPDPATLTSLPWRSEDGGVVRMFCTVKYPDGRVLESDSRYLLEKAVADAKKAGVEFNFGSELEFYMFKTDADGRPTFDPYDNAGYMDVAPEDKGENVRRMICRTLMQMGMKPQTSHHEEGPGQNEIDFHYSDPLTAADNAITFKSVVRSIASMNGLHADFSPRPLSDSPGSGFHINISINNNKKNLLDHMIAGIMNRICDITLFLNPIENSYQRIGSNKAPKFISWSSENRSQLIRVPAARQTPYMELRSPDPTANPYIAFTLLIYAGLEGISKKMELPESADINLFTAGPELTAKYKPLPANLKEAIAAAKKSSFLKKYLPESIIKAYCER